MANSDSAGSFPPSEHIVLGDTSPKVSPEIPAIHVFERTVCYVLLNIVTLDNALKLPGNDCASKYKLMFRIFVCIFKLNGRKMPGKWNVKDDKRLRLSKMENLNPLIRPDVPQMLSPYHVCPIA